MRPSRRSLLDRLRYWRRVAALASWTPPPGVEYGVLTQPHRSMADVRLAVYCPCGFVADHAWDDPDGPRKAVHAALDAIAARLLAALRRHRACPPIPAPAPDADDSPLGRALDDAHRAFVAGLPRRGGAPGV